MLRSKKSSSAFFILLCLFTSSSILSAQSKKEEKSLINIISNYEEFYVVIDGNVNEARRISSGETFEINAGRRRVWLIPEFSNPTSIEKIFETDSLYRIEYTFLSLLDKKNSYFERLETNDPTLVSMAGASGRLIQVSYKFLSLRNEAPPNEEEGKYGFLKIESNVDSLYVNTTGISKDTKYIASGDSISLKKGYNKVIISKATAVETTYRELIWEGQTTTINHSFDLTQPTVESLTNNIATEATYGSNLIIISDSDSDISLNGTNLGSGAAKYDAKTGTYDIIIKNEFTGEKKVLGKVLNTSKERAIVVDAYTKPIKSKAQIFSFVPGVSQLYKQEKIKGYSISAGFLITGALTFSKHIEYQKELDEFERLRKLYNDASNEQNVLELGDLAEAQQSKAKTIDNQRLAYFGLFSAIYIYNVFDGLTKNPKGGYRSKTDIDFYLKNEFLNNSTFTTLSFRYAF